jgi:TonB family protein
MTSIGRDALHVYNASIMFAKRYIQALFAIVVLASGAIAQEPRQVSNEEATQHLTKRVEPQYPKMAEIAHIQGAVLMEITITESGGVTGLKAISGHPILIQSAMDAVTQWQFSPFLEEGRPVAVRAPIKVDFSLGPGAELRNKYLQQEVECTRQIQNKMPPQAEVACKQALETAIKLPKSFASDKMRAYGYAGTAAYSLKKTDEALEDFKQQLSFALQALQPGSPLMVQVHSNLAHAYEATGNQQGAEAEYTETEKAQEAALADLESRREKLRPGAYEGVKASYTHSMEIILQEHVRLLRKMGKVSEAQALEQKTTSLGEGK